MKILVVGDLVGNVGLKKLEKEYNALVENNEVDFCIVNAENVADRNGDYGKGV